MAFHAVGYTTGKQISAELAAGGVVTSEPKACFPCPGSQPGAAAGGIRWIPEEEDL